MHERTANEGRTGGQILVDCLRVQGVELAFCVPGESYLAVLDALHDVKEDIKLVVCRQEGGAANMAEAHGKLTGRPGVCFATRGPGATNASTGVHTAFQDSTPMVLFIGQVARHSRDREGFQEVNLVAMFAPLAKWSAEINDPRRLPEYIHRAFQTAMSGRPGPVVLVLPEDMLTEIVTGEIEYGSRSEQVQAGVMQDRIDRLDQLLQRAKRPLLLVGGGGWSQAAGKNVLRFADHHDLPVASSLRCQDYVDNGHPNYVGHFGIGVEPTLAARLKEADMLIVLGARLGEMTTGGYRLLVPPRIGKTLVHIHADAEELDSVYQADLAINAGSIAASEALAAMPARGRRPWQHWVAAARKDYEQTLVSLPTDSAVNLGDIMVTLRDRLPCDTIVCNGAGNYTGWIHKHWQFSTYRTQLAPTSGAMGYGIPAGIAAAIALPGRQVLSIAGDGCFQMHFQELATAVQYGAKVLYIIVNNGIYGTIRMHQEREYPERVIATDIINPDFVTLATAYGLPAWRVNKTEDFEPTLIKALAAPGKGALIELVTDPNAITARTTIEKIRLAAAAKG